MSQVSLTVNGRVVSADVEPRTHLADFLREHLLLTGTHLGCEQGVCGACTILLNGEPSRSCIAYAALCEGSEVRTIEGLVDDPVIVALRQAFTAEHALQCGYCTPGMLVTARDIIRRLPDADEDRVRLELTGNLCRCTGYSGIVRAIRRVLEAGIAEPVAKPAPVLALEEMAAVPVAAEPARRMVAGPQMRQTLRLAIPVDVVWSAIQDPALMAACVPGARLTGVDGERLTGEMVAGLGPIQARFTGSAVLRFHPTSRTGRLAGEGRDSGGGSRLAAEANFAVEPEGAEASRIQLDIAYDLKGPLAQFSRGPIVAAFAAEVAETVARNLQARLQGDTPAAEPVSGGLLSLLWRVLARWFRGSR